MSITNPDLNNTSFPDKIQDIQPFLDITVEDAEKVKELQAYLRNGDFTSAYKILAQIPDGKRKFIGAQTLNIIRDTLIALERFYESQIYPYIENKQQEWQNIIDLFSFIEPFNPLNSYYVNNMVLYVDEGKTGLYIVAPEPGIMPKNPPAGTSPTDKKYFRKLTVQGKQGISGKGLANRFVYDPEQDYFVDDMVIYNNKWYVAFEDNTAKSPDLYPHIWKVMLQSVPAQYPIQVDPPVNQATGDIWFKVL